MLKRFIQALVFCLVTASAHAGPTLLAEGFESPILPGWTIVNNSTPGGSTGWFLGNEGIFPAQSGSPSSYAAANFLGAPTGGMIDNWLITPVLDLTTTLELSFWARTAGAFPDHLEIWGTTAGSSANTGDYSLLLTIDGGAFPTDWAQFNLLFGGSGATSGRLAFRYFIDDTSINGDYIGIDTIVISQAPEPGTIALLAFALGALLWSSRRARATIRR